MSALSCTMNEVARVGHWPWRRLLRRGAPIALAGIVALAILRKYPARDIAQAFAEGNALAVAPFAVLLAISFLAWGAAADTIVLRRFGAVRLLDVARGKAAASVLSVLGYFFSNGGYGVWIARRTGAGAARSAGLVLYVMMGDLAATGIVASLVIPWVRGVPTGLCIAAAGIAAGTLAVIALGPALAAAGVALLDPWRTVPRSVGFAQIALRCVNVASAALLMTLAARAFGLSIPVGTLLGCAPILLLIASLPVNVAGIGASQAAWLLFLLPYEEGPKILAFQLTWTAILGLSMVLRGLPFVSRAVEQIAADAPLRPGAG